MFCCVLLGVDNNCDVETSSSLHVEGVGGGGGWAVGFCWKGVTMDSDELNFVADHESQ